MTANRQSPQEQELAQLRQALRQRETEIALLKEATDAVSSQLDFDKVMQLIADRARTLLNTKTLLIPVLNEDCTDYTYIAGAGEDVDEVVGESLPINFGVCGWVWKNKRPWWRGMLDELDETEREQWKDEIGNIIMVPLIGKKHFLGGVTGINKIGDEPFNERDLELLSMFASQVSIAIENALSFKELTVAKKEAESYQKELGKLNEILVATNKDLEYLALYDDLTSLPNRNLIKDRIRQSIKQAEAEEQKLTILLIDLDNFKELNDTLGHDAGDVLLYEVAKRFRETLRPSDTIGRLGGDEFAVIIPDSDIRTAKQAAKDFLQSLENPFILQGNHYFLDASIGITLYPEHGADFSSLLKHADVAMYQAKQDTNGFSIYNPEQDEHSQSRLALSGTLRQACQDEAFEFYYQPKLDARTGKVVGAEALARWFDPEFGNVPPVVFIPLLENSGLIKSFTEILLRESIKQCSLWHQAGLNLNLSVNMSMHNLRDPNLPQLVARLLNQYRLPRRSLTLEITETVAMGDPQHLPPILAQLVLSGVELSIDDFGTGYSSLSYLKKMPLSELKIDKSFVIDMDKDPDNEVIVRSTVELAHNLGLSVVAEGVENKEVMQKLQQIGTDMLQGFDISRPLPADEFLKFVLATNQVSTWVSHS
ncbi:MAG: EAL domain-containing protein [Gammaproteobacteria bacterium]|nr:EAL domain-containing protein [Gammaproteobacteria bacterium]